MNSYYSRSYSQEDLNRLHDESNDANMMGMMGPQSIGQDIVGAQSLDDIVNQNAKDIRRSSMPMVYGHGSNEMDSTMRRVSMLDMDQMMEFGGASPTGPLNSFQFDPSTGPDLERLPAEESSGQNVRGEDRRSSNADLSINTHFPSRGSYGSIGAGAVYTSPMGVSNALDMDINSPYIPSALAHGLPMSMDLDMMGNTVQNADLFGASQYHGSPMVESPIHQNFPGSVLAQVRDPGGGPGITTKETYSRSNDNSATPDFVHENSRTNSGENTTQSNSRQGSTSGPSSNMALPSVMASPTRPAPHTGPPQVINGTTLPWSAPPEGWPSTMTNRPHTETQYKDVYAPSGYDLMGILIRVASRPNPQINIGSVDLSCAFVVTNAKIHDNPIEYVSESFERLTGYTKHEIRGQNCRFLQSPDGKVESGVKRKYCDDDSVLYLKNCISTQTEAQISLINYRKGGQPFMNLLTMIPICDENSEVSHFVGFQVDLVENPTAINSKNPDGTYSINYQRHSGLPGYLLPAPDSLLSGSDHAQTVPRDEVTAVLSNMDTGETEHSRRLMDKVLLENADDVIHVLSLKGLFLYLSPACRKVLEYDASDLVGTALSAICHPSDIVPVTRELKDTSSGASVSVVFRIRRKRSGYMWFESHGSLHTEQGKGRKCIILVGRERPVYTLNKSILNAAGGGVGENELWTKMSTTGMFLYVSSNVRQLLDRQPDELVGTNVQALMRPDSKEEFGRVLTLALTGKNTSVRHELTNKRGQVLQAFSWLYPGDAVEGQKPTFLVAQIRLIRYHRGGGHRGSLAGKEHHSAESVPSIASTRGVSSTAGGSTPMTATTGTVDTSSYTTAEGFPITTGGNHGLPIGRQDASLASDDNVFDELKTTRSTSWQFELRQMEKRNRILHEEVQTLIAAKKKRKRRRGAGLLQKDCANCHTKQTPEWRRGPSGQRDLCNSCGLRWAKQNGRVSPRNSQGQSVQSVLSDGSRSKGSKASASPMSDSHGKHNVYPDTSTAENLSPMSTAMGPPPDKRSTPQEASKVSHAAKVARMEVGGNQRLSGGVPAKIEEGSEPD